MAARPSSSQAKHATYIPPHHSDIVNVVVDDTRIPLKFTMGAIAYIEEAFDMSIEELATNFSKVHKAKFVIHVLYAGTLYNDKLSKEWSVKKFGDKIKPADFGVLLKVCAEALRETLGGGSDGVDGGVADGAGDGDGTQPQQPQQHQQQKKTVSA